MRGVPTDFRSSQFILERRKEIRRSEEVAKDYAMIRLCLKIFLVLTF